MKNKIYDIFIYLFSWTMLNVTAKNTYEVWAAQLHPCLVAYADLPENEREYDRNTAMETLKAIMKLGFEITIIY
jgi:hypothetical protein